MTLAAAPALEGLIRDAVAGARAAHRPSPGVVVGVRHGDEEATVGAGLPVHQPQRVCSITKLFTATLVALLADAGRLDLDAPVRAVVPELRLRDDRLLEVLSARHLLTHTSGLACELPDLARFGDGDDARLRAAAAFDELAVLAPPGRVFSYGNAGFWLLGAAVDHLAGRLFERALRELVAAPLGLERTEVTTSLRSGAVGHRTVDGRAVPVPESREMPRARVPSGGVASTVGDLVAFGAAHLAGAWGLSRETLASLREPAVDAADPPGRQGLGFWLGPSGALAGHAGGYLGFQTQLVLAPEHELVVAVLTDGLPGVRVIRDVVRAVLEARADARAVADWAPAPPPAVALRHEERERLEGRFGDEGVRLELAAARGGFRLVVEEDGERHELAAEATGPRALRITGPGPYAGEELDFPVADADGRLLARFEGSLVPRLA